MGDEEKPAVNVSEVPWRNRRRVMVGSLLFCMFTVAYVLMNDRQSSVAESAVTMSFITIMSTVGSYVFGKVWETRPLK